MGRNGPYLDDISPDDLSVPPDLPAVRPAGAFAETTQELVADLVLAHDREHGEALHVPAEQVGDLRHIALLHLAQPLVEQTRAVW